MGVGVLLHLVVVVVDLMILDIILRYHSITYLFSFIDKPILYLIEQTAYLLVIRPWILTHGLDVWWNTVWPIQGNYLLAWSVKSEMPLIIQLNSDCHFMITRSSLPGLQLIL